jgi:hypothetical protein
VVELLTFDGGQQRNKFKDILCMLIFASRWLRGVDGNVKNITEKEIFKGQATNLRKGGNFRKMLPHLALGVFYEQSC